MNISKDINALMCKGFTGRAESTSLQNERGTSVLELLAAISIFAIISGLAIPSIVAAQASFLRNNAVAQLEFDLRRAREQAMERGALGILQVNPDGTSYTFSLDFLPRSSPPAADEVIFTSALPERITIAADPLYLSSRGFVVDELENPATIAVDLMYDGQSFCAANVYATGRMVLENC